MTNNVIDNYLYKFINNNNVNKYYFTSSYSYDHIVIFTMIHSLVLLHCNKYQ